MLIIPFMLVRDILQIALVTKVMVPTMEPTAMTAHLAAGLAVAPVSALRAEYRPSPWDRQAAPSATCKFGVHHKHHDEAEADQCCRYDESSKSRG